MEFSIRVAGPNGTFSRRDVGTLHQFPVEFRETEAYSVPFLVPGLFLEVQTDSRCRLFDGRNLLKIAVGSREAEKGGGNRGTWISFALIFPWRQQLGLKYLTARRSASSTL